MGIIATRVWFGDKIQKGAGNLVGDHLSLLLDEVQSLDMVDIKEKYPDEQFLLMVTTVNLWYAYIVNYVIEIYVPTEFNSQ